MASVMDIDVENSSVSDQPKFSINVLQLLKSAQMQHGLRHGDYTRYRRYCTARLRRLYKSLRFTHGRGRYNRKVISESTVTDVSILMQYLCNMSNMSLTVADKKDKFLGEKLDVYEPAVTEANTKAPPRIDAFPPAFQAIPRNPIILDLALNSIDFPSLENRMKKARKLFGFF